MSNSLSFVGRLGNDPELKEVGSTTVLEFSIANNTGFGDKKSTNWFRAALWGKQGEAVQKFLSKGKEVFVTGELTIRKYEKDGVEKFSNDLKVSALDFVSGNGSEGSAPSQSESSSAETSEDLPF
jgi:single-strand DNA-binding protein